MAMTINTPTAKKVSPTAKTVFENHFLGGGRSNSSSFPLFNKLSYSLGRSSINLDKGIRCVKITESIGRLSGLKWVWKKWTTKIKTVASNASSLCIIVATLSLEYGCLNPRTTDCKRTNFQYVLLVISCLSVIILR